MLLYRLEIGKDEETILERARQFGGPIPDRIVNAPQLLEGLDIYVNMFNRAGRSRQLAQGSIGPIPYETLSKISDDYGLDEDEKNYAIDLLIQMDCEYVIWQNKFLKRKMEQDAKAPKGSPRRK